MEETLSPDAFRDASSSSKNVSGVLSASSYSLRDVSDSDSFAKADDADLLDASVLALLDQPYSQQHDRLRLRKQEQYDGFDNSTGSSWIYPTNYPVRQYQFTITKAALFKNTLVVLPTGLGKTFIAAVVMYNIYRWYPTGKVIFMAPTRPLVAQQIDACYRIMGIPREDTAEITGRQQRKNRTGLWQTKRVFYATPQVVQADLCEPEQAFPVDQVRLVVIDEAHKAKGRYAYTEVIRLIAARNKHFRVLALSATPGRTLEDVAEVIQNLLISHIEVRWDNSIDVSPYTFRRTIRTIVIPLGATIRTVREQLQQLVDPYVRRLLDANVLSCDKLASMTRGMLIMEQKRFRENSLLSRHPNHSTVNGDFSVCISMFHALDLLVRHGICALLNFFADGGEGASEKYFVAKDPHIKKFLEQLRERYSVRKDVQDSQDGTAVRQSTGDDDGGFGHPKFRILEKQLATHFADRPDSKAIVFCEFRDSVAMIHRLLSQRAPLIRPKCIVGQGGTSGIRAVTQKEQIAAMKQFRDGVCNTLIATCVAEEGIDVGEVDLIVCFDITKNPTRFVQRIGRTGRQRVGRVLMLVTEGEEHETLKRVLASKDRTNQQLARSKDIMRILYRHSPRLVPGEFEPKCVEMFITIQPEEGAVNATPNAGKRKSTQREHDRAVASKRRKVVGATSPKCTQDVRRFFQRSGVRHPADVDLDVSEREVFSLAEPTAGHSPEQSDISPGRMLSIPVDRCIRPGQSDQELAIERRLQPLVRHYEQLRRQKYIHRQQLLEVPTVEQILQRRSLAIVRSELVRQLLGTSPNAPCDTAPLVVKIDDPFDLPLLRELPESYRSHCLAGEISPGFRTSSPSPDALSRKSASAVKEASISNMFDSTLHVSDFEPTNILPSRDSELTATAPTTAIRKTAPVDGPLLRAFERSMRKRLLDDGRPAPHATSDAESKASTYSIVPEPETPPLINQAASRRKLVDVAGLSKTSVSDSPLMRAFYRSVQKRNNSNGGLEGSTNSALQRQMVLEYFQLRSIEEVFADVDGEESVRKYGIPSPVESNSDVNHGKSIQENSGPGKQLYLQQPVAGFQDRGKESTASGNDGEQPVPVNRGVPSIWVSPRSSRCPVLPDPDQENKNSSKNFNLGSAALVFDDSDSDMFDSAGSNINETAGVPVDGKIEVFDSPECRSPGEFMIQREHRTAATKSILVETQQQKQPVGNDSHFEAIEKSPSVFAVSSRVAKSRLAPTKLNFSRLHSDNNRQQQKLAIEIHDIPRPITPVERVSSPFFNNCDSQMTLSQLATPWEAVEDPPVDLHESVITGHRLMRGQFMCQLASDPESEGEREVVGTSETPACRVAIPTTVEELKEDDDDIFENCKSNKLPDRKLNVLPPARSRLPPTSKAAAPRKNQRKQSRYAVRSFFDSQAVVSGSEDEDEECEIDGSGELNSFIDPGGSQSSEANGTCVDMRAVYLQSVRSPMRTRGCFKMPATRVSSEYHNLRRLDGNSSTHTSFDHPDRYVGDYGGHSQNISSSDHEEEEQEYTDSSFITDEIVVDAKLSELEQAELVLRKRRRAAKRTRERAESKATETKRRRRIVILSDSE